MGYGAEEPHQGKIAEDQFVSTHQARHKTKVEDKYCRAKSLKGLQRPWLTDFLNSHNWQIQACAALTIAKLLVKAKLLAKKDGGLEAYYRDVRVWLSEIQYGCMVLHPCPYCCMNKHVVKHCWPTNHVAWSYAGLKTTKHLWVGNTKLA